MAAFNSPTLPALATNMVEVLAFSYRVPVPLSQSHLFLPSPSLPLRYTQSVSSLLLTSKWPLSTDHLVPLLPFLTILTPGSYISYPQTFLLSSWETLISLLTLTTQPPQNSYHFLPPLASLSGPPQPLTMKDILWTLSSPASAPYLTSPTLLSPYQTTTY